MGPVALPVVPDQGFSAAARGGGGVAARSPERLRVLVESHGPALRHYLARLGVPLADLEDAAQEVFLIVSARLGALEPAFERSFLFSTAFRVALNARRSKARRLRTTEELGTVVDEPQPSVEDLSDQLYARELLDEALEQLPTDCRLVFLLHEVHDLPLASVAKRLGLPRGTVMSRLRRARAIFGECVTRIEASVAFDRSKARSAPAPGAARVTDQGDAEIVSWWARGGEVDALRALVGVYERIHPNASIIAATVRETAAAYEQVRSRMTRGVPPDTFQVNGGIDLLRWVRRGVRRDRMEPLDFLYSSEGWDSAFPRDVLDLVTYSGRLYAVPTNIHRTNTLFFNPRVLRDAGVTVPTTLSELHDVAGTLRAQGVVPFAIGYKEPWTLTMLAFENVMVAVAGGDYYREFFTGRRRAGDSELRATLAHVARILDYANPNASDLGWDGAVDLLQGGEAAMTITGDWAKGYLAARGLRVDRDFGQVVSPGGAGAFVFTTDTFGLPKHACQRAGAIEFLKVFGSEEGQNAFNPLKGSIPARVDVDLSHYDALAQATASDFRTQRRYPGLTSLVPSAFKRVLDSAMARFARDRDAGAVVTTIQAHYDLLTRA
jgi:glucose/mannose transport system substrate-binding protein